MKYFLAILIIFTIVASFLFLNKPQDTSTTPIPKSVAPPSSRANVDFSAKFLIYTNGLKRDFSAPMYHEQSIDVFIESLKPNYVKIKKASVSWQDFFNNLHFKLTKKCLTTGTRQTYCDGSGGKLRFYLNGRQDPNLLDKTIFENDEALVTFGNESNAEIEKQLAELSTL